MVQYDLNDTVRLKFWNLEGLRLLEIFENIFTVDALVPVTINVYEPLRDTNAELLETMKFVDGREQIFIIFSGEGHGEQEYDRLLQRFYTDKEFAKVKKQNIILYTAALSLGSNNYHHISNMSGILNTTIANVGFDLRLPPITRHFLFLNRLHRWQRQRLFENMFLSGLFRHSHCSYLESPTDTRYPALYPMIIDGDLSNIDIDRGFDIGELPGALFNIVSESSFENLGGHDHIEAPGISEKTFKTIINSQIPIFLSSYKTVYYYRMLGFDVFDDIVDHSYDLMQDPHSRIEAITQELKRIALTPFDDLLALQERLLPRFIKNHRLLAMYSGLTLERPQWLRLFKTLGIVT